MFRQNVHLPKFIALAAKFQAQPPSFPPDLQSHKGEEFDHFPVANMQPQGLGVMSQDSNEKKV